ncbi:beta-lactamase-like protein [Cercophora scortea]|uniref:Beta-lactamase-like protein n=1 Tax=Cercophora scortea TaxID=314031 RepID=A0AAE0IFX2_9PEZI|nr:beta-lactamase-like protein [Cercophora scortea]
MPKQAAPPSTLFSFLDTTQASTEASLPRRHGTVQVHALSAGHFSLPEEQFVHPSSPSARSTVPSLCFLIQHIATEAGQTITTRIVFDLGLRRDISRYSEPIQRHVATRQPMTTEPDVVASLRAGGLTPDDIHYVVYSHVHWDHVGEPRDFPHSTFVVGHGSLGLLSGLSASGTLRGGHSFFEADLLDPSRTIELSDPTVVAETTVETSRSISPSSSPSSINFNVPWAALGDFPSVLDLFQDGSLFIVDAPGHLPGHINLLARASGDDDCGGGSGGRDKWVYLAGDACHDRRIMRKEREIGEWHDAHDHACCIHADRANAEATIERLRTLEGKGVEVIFAHDVEWENDERNRGRYFGAQGAGEP